MKSFDYPVIFQSWKFINFTYLFYRPGKSFYFITSFLGLKCCIILWYHFQDLEFLGIWKVMENDPQYFFFEKWMRNISLICCLRLFESKLLIYGHEKVQKFYGKGQSKTVWTLTIYRILWSLINELGVILFGVVIPLLTGNL